jgi:DnaJ family protein C protein 3
MSYFLLGSATAMNHIKQCLHYDPDSKPCKKVHKLLRSLEKDTAKVRNFVEGGSWRQAIRILDGEEGLLARFEKALSDASTDHGGALYLAPQFSPKIKSQSRLELYALACKAAVGANELKKDKGMRWCDEALSMDEGNVDGLIGRGERLLKDEKWDEAVRVFEQAFEKSGRSSQDVSCPSRTLLRLDCQSPEQGEEAAQGVETEGLLQGGQQDCGPRSRFTDVSGPGRSS